ncbi:hypothetical protein V6N13_123103 [Hibiscus sabdariffa]|uniref:Uncharacterized protein n=2 Tax=Hibiscus sabdariffa TaxID=183260 RepID=A0ABR2CXR6_9ROSI
MGATSQSADVVILAMVLVCSPMLGLVLGCRCVSGAIGVTLESVGGLLELVAKAVVGVIFRGMAMIEEWLLILLLFSWRLEDR